MHSHFAPVTKLIILLLVSASTMVTNASYASESGPFNRIAVILDASGTFRAKRAVALEKAGALLEQVAERKSRRWEAKDQMVVISLDSMPEVIWSGPAHELAANRDYIVERFAARKDYEGCTDVTEGLRLAVNQLNRDPQPEYKYAFIFSDLLNEPPTDSPSHCAPAQAVLPESFEWEAFADINTTVLWIPAKQKFAWKKATRDAGLEETFQLYSESDSQAIQIRAPKKAEHVMTATEKRQGREKVKGIFGTVLVYGSATIGALSALCVLGFLATLALSRRTRR